MPVVMVGCVVSFLFCFGFLFPGDLQSSFVFAFGPLAVFFLFPKESRKELEQKMTAGEWLEYLGMIVLIGFFYTGGIGLGVALVFSLYAWIFQKDIIFFEPYLLALAIFLPHFFLAGKKIWLKRFLLKK